MEWSMVKSLSGQYFHFFETGEGKIFQISNTYIQTLLHDENHQLTYAEANPSLM